jgi:hypothetical protein
MTSFEPTSGNANDSGSAKEERPSAAVTRQGLTTQLRELEAFIARSEAAGESLPPEALEMVDKLREIVRALDALTSSLGEE